MTKAKTMPAAKRTTKTTNLEASREKARERSRKYRAANLEKIRERDRDYAAKRRAHARAVELVEALRSKLA